MNVSLMFIFTGNFQFETGLLTWLFCRVVKKQRILEFSKSRETLKTAVLWNVFCFNFTYAFRVTNAHFIREFYDNLSATN